MTIHKQYIAQILIIIQMGIAIETMVSAGFEQNDGFTQNGT